MWSTALDLGLNHPHITSSLLLRMEILPKKSLGPHRQILESFHSIRNRSWWSIQQRRKPKMHHFQREAGEKASNHPNLGASPSLAWMQREPGAWWTGAANARTSQQPPSVLKDGGHLGRLCRQKKRWISLDIVPLIGETWLLSGYIAKCFHKRNWEVVKSQTGWSMVYLWEENTRGSFGRYLQDNGFLIPPYSNLEASQLLNRR